MSFILARGVFVFILVACVTLSCVNTKSYYFTPRLATIDQNTKIYHSNDTLFISDTNIVLRISGWEFQHHSSFSLHLCSQSKSEFFVNDSSFHFTDVQLIRELDPDFNPHRYGKSYLGPVSINANDCQKIVIRNTGRLKFPLAFEANELQLRNKWYDRGLMEIKIFNPDSTVYRHLELYYIRDGIRKKLRSVSAKGVVFNKYEIELELLLDKPDMLFMQDKSYDITASIRTKPMSKAGLQAKSKYFLSVDSLNIISLHLGKVVQPPISEIRSTKGGHVYSFTNIKIPMEEDMLKIRFRTTLTERETGLIWKIEYPFCRLLLIPEFVYSEDKIYCPPLVTVGY